MKHANRSQNDNHKRGRGTGQRKFGKKRLDRGIAQTQDLEKPRKRLDYLKESLLLFKAKEIHRGLTMNCFFSQACTFCLLFPEL